MILKACFPTIAVILVFLAGSACGGPPSPSVQPGSPPLTVNDVRLIDAAQGLAPTSIPVEALAAEEASSPGEPVYDERCAVCHGEVGGGGVGPALSTEEFGRKFSLDKDLLDIIRGGRGGMPAYDNSKIGDQEMADLVSYIRSLQ